MTDSIWWDKAVAGELLKHGLDHTQIGTVVGLIAEHRQICYHEGYHKGFNDGSDLEKKRANRTNLQAEVVKLRLEVTEKANRIHELWLAKEQLEARLSSPERF